MSKVSPARPRHRHPDPLAVQEEFNRDRLLEEEAVRSRGEGESGDADPHGEGYGGRATPSPAEGGE